jgi:hypothetical protein
VEIEYTVTAPQNSEENSQIHKDNYMMFTSGSGFNSKDFQDISDDFRILQRASVGQRKIYQPNFDNLDKNDSDMFNKSMNRNLKRGIFSQRSANKFGVKVNDYDSTIHN